MAPLHLTFFAIALGRLHAAFNCDRRFLIIVGTYFGLQLAWMLALYAVFAANFQVIELPQTWTGCMPSRPGAYEWMMWIPAVSTEGALLAILLIKGTQIVHQGIRPPRALFVILRDNQCDPHPLRKQSSCKHRCDVEGFKLTEGRSRRWFPRVLTRIKPMISAR
ncbi:hypothetical protein BKA93DRAFT_482999 [Sparassis latifolia]